MNYCCQCILHLHADTQTYSHVKVHLQKKRGFFFLFLSLYMYIHIDVCISLHFFVPYTLTHRFMFLRRKQKPPTQVGICACVLCVIIIICFLPKRFQLLSFFTFSYNSLFCEHFVSRMPVLVAEARLEWVRFNLVQITIFLFFSQSRDVSMEYPRMHSIRQHFFFVY